ncbi:hypothetical protein ElyMa_003620600 [Elysia marginata]|uniref:Uncharacterized protein n=1 Tax=Elysia marginata TaxID=1093978 RepID=A0AAV4EU17_9GAST|nr:hypothetical protein ElyMa_003620600 [Elysia marginata]
MAWSGIEPATSKSRVRRADHCKSWQNKVPDTEVLKQANLPSITTIVQTAYQRWTGHKARLRSVSISYLMAAYQSSSFVESYVRANGKFEVTENALKTV